MARKLSPKPRKQTMAQLLYVNQDNFDQQHLMSMQTSCKTWLTWALRSLGGKPNETDLDRIAALIWATVATQNRSFHNFEHILRLAESEDPITTLAALFHDAIYVQVDCGLVPEVADYLMPFLVWNKGALYVRPASDLRLDPESAQAVAVFGLNHTEPVLAEHLNEFLSSILVVRALKPWLSEQQLVQVIVAIEATIPFRSTAEFVPAEQLFNRLVQVNQEFSLGLTLEECERAIHRSVEFANRDVENFSFADPVIFLDNTWQLLPELNPALRDPRRYSIRDYRKALRAMETFFVRLDSDQIFQQFRQVPNSLIYQAWRDRSQHNLATARLYISTKLVAIAVLEALTSRTDQSRPLTNWLGPIESSSRWDARVATQEGQVSRSLVEQQVLQIVAYGRMRPCQFDLVKSPFTAFLLRSLGFEKMIELRPIAERFFNAELSSDDFLDLLPYFDHAFQI